MISGEMLNMLLIGGAIGGVTGFLFGVPYLKKNIDIPKALSTADSVLKVAEPVINLTSNLAPNNTMIEKLKTIEKWATIAVGHAEQLYHAGDIDKEKRKNVAKDVVYETLKELNIELTDSKKTLVDAAIENAVNDLGHMDKTEAKKEAEKQALQNQVAQLTNERDNLKNTISQINATTARTVQSE